MRRYWIDKKDFQGDTILISDENFHHIVDVCRQEVGHRFEVVNGDGKAYLVELTKCEKKRAMAQVLSSRDLEALREPYIHLCLSVPRFPVADAIVEKAVELGVSEVSFFVSDFSFVRDLKDLSENRMKRWEKIVQSATRQSGRGTLMTLHSPTTFKKLLTQTNQKPNAMGLFCYEGEGVFDIKTYLGKQAQAPAEIYLFVGSEGGFSMPEVQYFQTSGLQPVTLGQQVLRVETACVALVSVIKYHWDLMK